MCVPCKDREDCDLYWQGKHFFWSFNQGFTGELYAKNFSTCGYDTIDYVFKEVPTYKVKLHYGDYQDIITNTTLFLVNTTIIFHVCTDVIENIYYYALY